MEPLVLVLLLCVFQNVHSTVTINQEGYGFEPNWDSLDKRPLPKWYDEAKFGIFLHWGVYSVPSYGSEWFWANWKGGSEKYKTFMKENYIPGFTYQDFASDFTAEFFDPKAWAELFKNSGAQYIVLTSKHHEGFTLWPSEYSFSWNAVDVGPKRDLVGELAEAVRNKSLKFGVYHSLFEWFNPLYLSDKASNFTQNIFPTQKIIPEMIELIQKYRPEVIWSDGDWEASDTYWKSKEFLAWLYNESPVKDTVVVNDRWGRGVQCKHGDFFNCKDRYNPAKLLKHKWENAMTVDKHSWGFRRDANLVDFLTIEELLRTMAVTVSCGGNLLMNVGPTHDGRIVPIFQQRLADIGEWLSINGKAIYKTSPWKTQNDTVNGKDVWYTSAGNTVYAIALSWPEKNNLELGSAIDLFNKNEKTEVTLLGNSDKLKWSVLPKSVSIQLPDKATVKSKWAWVVEIQPSKSY